MDNTRINHQLDKLSLLLNAISTEHYCHPVEVLSGATIGQHCRHILEILACLMNGYETGKIDYENRQRNKALESNPAAALQMLAELTSYLNKPNKTLQLLPAEGTPLDTNYHRELLYNLEHCIHHFALIKVALLSLGMPVTDDQFGVGYSTIAYRAS